MDAIGTLGKNVDCRTQEKVTINRKTKANRAYSIGRKLVPYLMILPAMLIFMVFVIYPVIHMVYVSFFNWNMIADMKYVGLKNYVRMFKSKDFWLVLGNTFRFMVMMVPATIILSLGIAVYLKKNTRVNRLLQNVPAEHRIVGLYLLHLDVDDG